MDLTDHKYLHRSKHYHRHHQSIVLAIQIFNYTAKLSL
jgi:hypothetical protein